MFSFLSKNYLLPEAAELIAGFAASCPPPKLIGQQRVTEKMVAQAMQALYGKTAELVKRKRLGILGRARLAKAIQTILREQGYAEELTAQVVGAVTVNSLVAQNKR